MKAECSASVVEDELLKLFTLKPSSLSFLGKGGRASWFTVTWPRHENTGGRYYLQWLFEKSARIESRYCLTLRVLQQFKSLLYYHRWILKYCLSAGSHGGAVDGTVSRLLRFKDTENGNGRWMDGWVFKYASAMDHLCCTVTLNVFRAFFDDSSRMPELGNTNMLCEWSDKTTTT